MNIQNHSDAIKLKALVYLSLIFIIRKLTRCGGFVSSIISIILVICGTRSDKMDNLDLTTVVIIVLAS